MRQRSRIHPTRRALTAALSALVLVVACVVAAAAVSTPATAAPALLSQGRTATASSTENAGTPASAAVDGNTGTRWSSAFGDPQWLQVDLGTTATLSQVTLNWETAYASAFKIQISDNASTWTDLYSTTTGTGGTQTLNVSGTGRYVRLYGTARATAYGYSLWEFQVYGTTSGTACGTADAAQGRPATASSTENAGTPASAAVDGNSATRWSSAFSDPQWLQIDLGSATTICKVVLTWETAHATAFRIQASGNASTWTDLYSTTTGTGGTQTLAVNGTGRYVRLYGTARATAYGYSLWSFTVNTTGGSTDPSPSPTTGPTIPPDAFWGDTSTIPAAGNVVMVKILNRTNGQYPDSQVYWSYNGQVHSIAEQPYFDMPANTAGRMYFYLGSPNSQYYDFIEFTVGPSVFNGNTTRVDAFGLKLAMRLHARDGYDVAVGEDYATFAESRAATFQRFADEVPTEFKQLAQVQAPYRIPAPGSASIFQPGGAYANYFTGYAAQQGVTATTSQVTGCAGPLSEAPKMCAALNRHVAGLSDAQQSDASNYYTAAPANYYAKFWHDHAIGKLAYGFPYDDYAGQSSFISHGDPQWLLVAVGW
ncbi:discoidin domain-containing protein [Microbispora bryophytorum]|uniref:discoidin domain-containing protein n=1 Tax=Microbispora bryophytorum TaxID=1460882 RepID=UPI0033F2AA0F